MNAEAVVQAVADLLEFSAPYDMLEPSDFCADIINAVGIGLKQAQWEPVVPGKYPSCDWSGILFADDRDVYYGDYRNGSFYDGSHRIPNVIWFSRMPSHPREIPDGFSKVLQEAAE